MALSRSYIERNLAKFTAILQDSVFAEAIANQSGWLQDMDPRIKISGFTLLLLASAVSHSMTIIILTYCISLLLAVKSHAFSLGFVRRVWIFMPFYTGLITLPALFITPGDPLAKLGHWTITVQGARAAAFLLLRVATSVSFMFLLVLTTSWPRLLKALRALGVPRSFVFLIAMTYRYIYVLLHSANELFLARKSRKVGVEKWQNTSQWLGSLLSALLTKSYRISNEVFLAMQSRGFRGEPVILHEFKLRKLDIVWMIFFLLFSSWAIYFGSWSYP